MKILVLFSIITVCICLKQTEQPLNSEIQNNISDPIVTPNIVNPFDKYDHQKDNKTISDRDHNNKLLFQKTEILDYIKPKSIIQKKVENLRSISQLEDKKSQHNYLNKKEKGIDVSMYQGHIDWHKVKIEGHVDFAFIKATQGISYIDPDFQRNWKDAGRAGIKRGAYCFFDSNQNPIQQAKFFLKHAHKGELPPVLDLETTNGMSHQEVESRALAWLNYVEQHFQKPILYTYSSFGSTILKNKEFEKYPLWIADYGPSHPDIPSTWKGHYAFWQFGQSSIPGIQGKVDRDISN